MKKLSVALGFTILLVAAMAWLVSNNTVPTINDNQPVAASQPVEAEKTPPPEQTQSIVKQTVERQSQARVQSQEPNDGLDKEAILSMSQARRLGDDRRPPMAGKEPARELPAADELGDPAAYSAYEARQEKQVYRAFVDAVPSKVAEIEAVLAQAEQPGSGVSDDDIIMAKEKIAQLNAMKAQLEKELTLPDED